jgi:hypothetical protein
MKPSALLGTSTVRCPRLFPVLILILSGDGHVFPFPGKDPRQSYAVSQPYQQQQFTNPAPISYAAAPLAPPPSLSHHTLQSTTMPTSHPAQSFSTPQTSYKPLAQDSKSIILNPEVDRRREFIRAKINKVSHLNGYEPMFGWNPVTGEPHLILRTVEVGMIVGFNNKKILIRLEEEVKAITGVEVSVFYIRDGNLLVFWPEFKSSADMEHDSSWLVLNEFWSYLFEWSNLREDVPQIDVGYTDFMRRPEDQRELIPFPAEFPLQWIPDHEEDFNQESEHQYRQGPSSQAGSCRSSADQISQHAVLTPKYDPNNRISKPGQSSIGSTPRGPRQQQAAGSGMNSQSMTIRGRATVATSGSRNPLPAQQLDKVSKGVNH